MSTLYRSYLTERQAMIRTLLVALALAPCLAYLLGYYTTPSHHHNCTAPCTVVLPPNTEEDEFKINYGWRDSHTPIVDVYKHKP